jgi:hypothetical protein
LSAMPRAPGARAGCGPGSRSCPGPRFSESRVSKTTFSARPILSWDFSSRAAHQARCTRPENCSPRCYPSRSPRPSHQCDPIHWDCAHRGAGSLFVPASQRMLFDGELGVAPWRGGRCGQLRDLLRVHDGSHFVFQRAAGVSGGHAQGGQCAGTEILRPRGSGDDSPSLHSIRAGDHASIFAGGWSGSSSDWRSAGFRAAASTPAGVSSDSQQRCFSGSVAVRISVGSEGRDPQPSADRCQYEPHPFLDRAERKGKQVVS